MNLFLRFTLLAAFVLSSAQPAFAQDLSASRFQVRGYNVNELGYPGKMIPGDNRRFYFTEYWEANKFRRTTNFYLQCMFRKMNQGQEQIMEAWASPVSREGKPTIQDPTVFEMDKNLAVVGRQPNGRRQKSVIQFFDAKSGKEVGPQQDLTPFKYKEKNYVDIFAKSPNGERLLWLGYDPEDAPHKRDYEISVWKSEGRMLARGEVYMKTLDEKKDYDIADVVVDKRGNAFFLLLPKYKKDEEIDLDKQPVIVRYDSKDKSAKEFPVEFAGTQIPFIKLHITKSDNLVVFAITTKPGDNGLKNGKQLDSGERTWSNYEVKRFNLMRQMLEEASSLTPLPDSLAKRYAADKRGANFADSRVIEEDGKLFWLLEEQFDIAKATGRQYFYEDMGIIAFEEQSADFLWNTYTQKAQSDVGGNSLLSYVAGTDPMWLHTLFLTKRGAGGKILLRSYNKETGGFIDKTVAKNETGNLLFFPRRSFFDRDHFTLLGVGGTNKNDYYILTIRNLQ